MQKVPWNTRHVLQKKPTTRPGPAGDQEAQYGKRVSRPALVLVQPHQLRIARKVGDLDHVEGVVPLREDPAHVAVEKTGVARRVHVVFGVGMQMMVAMLGRPPQHALLQRALARDGKDELEDAAGRIGAMGEVAVIAGADREDAAPIERDAENDRLARSRRSRSPQNRRDAPAQREWPTDRQCRCARRLAHVVCRSSSWSRCARISAAGGPRPDLACTPINPAAPYPARPYRGNGAIERRVVAVPPTLSNWLANRRLQQACKWRASGFIAFR